MLRGLGVDAVSVKCQIKDFNILQKKLDDIQKAPKKVIERTLSDMRKRAPGWVASEIVQVYGVKKGEISSGKIGSVKVMGNDIKSMKIRYRGRVLTPTHFGMTPKAPGQNAYTLKASILKSQKATLGKVKKLTKKQRKALGKNFTRSGTQNSDHSPIMLMRAGGTTYIPFQRKSRKRNDVEAIKTLSLPQMISSMRTQPQIQKAINEGLEKRLSQHMKLLEK